MANCYAWQRSRYCIRIWNVGMLLYEFSTSKLINCSARGKTVCPIRESDYCLIKAV